MNKVYLIGNGYVCDFITEYEREGIEFIGVCRSDKHNCHKNIRLDISKDNSKLRDLIQEKSIVVYLAPPQLHGNRDLILNNFLNSIHRDKILKIIYISTSGVYGDRKDGVVNEEVSVNPITDRAKRRVDAEKQIRASGINYTILRVPGIYGKGRLPLKRIFQKLPLIRSDICKHTNLIHVKDLANIIIKCLESTVTSCKTINVSDGTPIKTTNYYLHIYDALGLSYPEFISYEVAYEIYDEKRISFINESRILNTSLMDELFPNIIKFKSVVDGIKDSLK